MLNPYRGIVKVVAISGAVAVSRYRVAWSLYIQGGTEREIFADGSVHTVSLPDVRFGPWSERSGLRRAPVRFVTEYEQIDRLGGQLLAAV
jgi:hypothetical protein